MTAGEYALDGELCGVQTLLPDTGRFHLDPARLADRAEGWTLHREPGESGSSARYTIRRRGAPVPGFTLQRLEKHPEAGGGDRWVDVTASLPGLQAGGRLRPKP